MYLQNHINNQYFFITSFIYAYLPTISVVQPVKRQMIELINIHFKGYGRKRSWSYERYYPSICMEGPIKHKRNLSQDNWSLDQDLNPGPLEYEVGLITNQPQCSIFPLYHTSLTTVNYYLLSFNACTS
jgi:hypothetical protein